MTRRTALPILLPRKGQAVRVIFEDDKKIASFISKGLKQDVFVGDCVASGEDGAILIPRAIIGRGKG